MRASVRGIVVLAAVLLAWHGVVDLAVARGQATAAADTAGGIAAAAADSALTALPAAADSADTSAQSLADALLDARLLAMEPQPEASGPVLVSWSREPKVGISAKVSRVSYTADFDNNFTLDKQVTVNQKASYATESYRKQDKDVEKRDGSVMVRSGSSLPVDANLRMNWNWSEDRTVNTASKANLNKRDFKQASLGLTKNAVGTGPVTHDLSLTGSVDDQRNINQQKINDFSEGRLAGAIRSKYKPAEGVSLATSVYQQHTAGDRALGDLKSPSSADTDSLGGGVFYKRGRLDGSFSIKKSTLNKRYLDYNRNANNLIDTISPGVTQKIVEELERQDAISLQWQSRLNLGRLGLATSISRDLDENSFRASGSGLREKHVDRAKTDLSYRYAEKDSVKMFYNYQWQWDDQTYKGATESRGRQVNKRREFELTWEHHLFAHTGLQGRYATSLAQDIAKKDHNDNDRDRLENMSSLRLTSDWTGKFRTTMTFTNRHIEDISIRSSRSSNNNEKDTYEIGPGYSWKLAPWLDWKQDFRLSIQFTDYVFSDLASVSRNDDYNKRGNLNTRVTVKPSSRLSVTVSHEYNTRFNATRSRTDAAGNDFYQKDLEQKISTIDFGLVWNATDWLKFEGASFRTKDLKDQLGASTTTSDIRSGEVWLGGTVNKTWDDVRIAAAIKRFNAFGPNIQETHARYWDADVSLTWKF